MSFECQFIFSPWSIVQLFDEFRALGQSLTIGFDLAGKRLRLNQDAKFVAVADTHPGEVGAAEEDLVLVTGSVRMVPIGWRAFHLAQAVE